MWEGNKGIWQRRDNKREECFYFMRAFIKMNGFSEMVKKGTGYRNWLTAWIYYRFCSLTTIKTGIKEA